MAKKKIGRPTSYKPEYCQEIIDYFSCELNKITRDFKHGEVEKANYLPTLMKFAMKLGVDTDTLVEWKKVHPDFSVAYNKAKKLQEQFIAENVLRGNYSAPFAIFMMKNVTKWRDEDDKNWSDRNELSGPEGGPIQLIL